MANTYQLISSVTVGAGGASSIDFTSIPATYTDLCLVWSSRCTSGGGGLNVKFNSSTTGYSERLLYADSGGAKSANTSSQTTFVWGLSNPSSYTANTFANGQLYIPNYAGSTNKSISMDSVTENNAAAAEIYLDAGLLSNTAAITSITLTNNINNFAQYSTAYLYGISNS